MRLRQIFLADKIVHLRNCQEVQCYLARRVISLGYPVVVCGYNILYHSSVLVRFSDLVEFRHFFVFSSQRSTNVLQR